MEEEEEAVMEAEEEEVDRRLAYRMPMDMGEAIRLNHMNYVNDALNGGDSDSDDE